MEKSFSEIIRHHMLCLDHGMCIGCDKLLRCTSVLCSSCKLFRYCSPQCLENDEIQHAPACAATFYFKSVCPDAPIEYAFKEVLNIQYSIKLLDSNGDFKSPAVIYEAYLVRNSNSIARKISKLHKVSESPETSETNVCDKINRNDTSQSVSNVDSINTPSFNDHIDKASECTKNSEHSNNNQSSGETKINKSQGTHGSEHGSKYSGNFKNPTIAQSNTENHSVENIHNPHTSRNNLSSTEQTSKLGKSAKINNKSSGSCKTRKQSESDTFGSGWWKRDLSGHSKTGSSPATKLKSLQCSSQSGSTEMLSGQDKTRTTTGSNSALGNCASNKGNLSSNKLSNTTTNNARTTTNSSNNARTTSNSDLIRNIDNKRSDSNENVHNNDAYSYSPNGNITSKNCKEQSGATAKLESEKFGAGWWKYRAAENKKQAKSSKSKKNQISFKVVEPEEQNRSTFSENRCEDVIPYLVNIPSVHKARFDKVASFIPSEVIWREKIHGRILVMDLFPVPGLWKAMLGGSCISLVAEISSRFPSPNNMLGIIIRDKQGHTAPVLLNTTESAPYNLLGVEITMSQSLTPGNFIILREVKWEQLPSGQLAIIMTNMKNVAIIFYQLFFEGKWGIIREGVV